MFIDVSICLPVYLSTRQSVDALSVCVSCVCADIPLCLYICISPCVHQSLSQHDLLYIFLSEMCLSTYTCGYVHIYVPRPKAQRPKAQRPSPPYTTGGEGPWSTESLNPERVRAREFDFQLIFHPFSIDFKLLFHRFSIDFQFIFN